MLRYYDSRFAKMIITMNDTTRNLILPLEFGLEIYSDYEQVFVRMKFRDNQDKNACR